jgi:molybdopterin synthase catalytic subunit
VISSEHRKDSLNAVSFAIDELKRSVPIWKKEHFTDNAPIWKENKEYEPISSDR